MHLFYVEHFDIDVNYGQVIGDDKDQRKYLSLTTVRETSRMREKRINDANIFK